MKIISPQNRNHDWGYEHTEEEGGSRAGKIHEVDRSLSFIDDTDFLQRNL